MRIVLDYSGEERVLLVQSTRKGKSGRATALQSALRSMGKTPSYGFCLHVIETDYRVEFDELPDAN